MWVDIILEIYFNVHFSFRNAFRFAPFNTCFQNFIGEDPQTPLLQLPDFCNITDFRNKIIMFVIVHRHVCDKFTQQ